MKITKGEEDINLQSSAIVQKKVIELLKDGKWFTTSELSENTGFNCYGACRSLEDKGLIKSSLDNNYTLWDPVTQQVVTKENYDAIVQAKQEAIEKLRKQYEEEGLSEAEIEEKLIEVTNPKSLEYKERLWKLEQDVSVMIEDEEDTTKIGM